MEEVYSSETSVSSCWTTLYLNEEDRCEHFLLFQNYRCEHFLQFQNYRCEHLESPL
jgi:hypothetical protein